ncbi:hypothetical protein ABPG74_010203 [Tetrahymena malaccensis]
MGSTTTKSKVVNLQQDQSVELNPMCQEQDLEKSKQEKETTKKGGTSIILKRIVTIVVSIALLIEPIYSTYISYKAYNNFNNLSDQIKTEVTDRYQQRMILDISISTGCNGEWDTLFLWMFQGANIRCDCRGKLGDNITVDFCSPDQEAAGCTQFNFINEKVLSLYPSGPKDDNSTQICVKQYVGGPTFATIKSWNQNCPSGQKLCGGSSIESKVCIDSSQLCPINSIVVQPTNPDPTIYLEQQIYNSTHNIYYSRTSNSLPINYYQVTSGEGPCYNITQENTYQGRVDPFNFKVQRTPCEIDPRWTRVAEVGEYSFYVASGIDPPSYFKEVWSFYQISDIYRYGFYVAHYPDWKFNNRDLISQVTDFVNNRENIMSFQTVLLYLNVANLVLNGLFALLLIYMLVKSATQEEQDKMASWKDYYNNLIKIGQLGVCIFQVLTIEDYLNTFKKCIDNQVSDQRTNQILLSVYNYMNTQVYEADKKLIISTAAGFAVAILGFLFNLYQKRKKQKEEEQQQQQ